MGPTVFTGPAHTHLQSICFSISMSTAFLPFELPAHSRQHALSSLAEDGTEGQGFSHFGKLFSSLRTLPCVQVIKLLFDFSPINLRHANLILRAARIT